MIARWGLRIVVAVTLAFIYLPIILIVVYAFNVNRAATWPPPGFSLQWVAAALESRGLRDAFTTSLIAGLGATTIALVLGSLAAFAVSRFTFFGRETISFIVILPIALPGIVTAIALRSTFNQFDIPLGMATIIVGHATFCVVLIYNNAVARLRRSQRNAEEASMDLGADGLQTFRRITFPALRSALLAGALLAFALSFDEIIVTNFTAGGIKTLPLWIFQNYRLANQAPIVNVAAIIAILLSVIPVYFAQRIAGAESATTH